MDSRAVQTLLCSHFLPSEELGKFKSQFKTVAAVLAFCLLSRWEILSPTFALLLATTDPPPVPLKSCDSLRLLPAPERQIMPGP